MTTCSAGGGEAGVGSRRRLTTGASTRGGWSDATGGPEAAVAGGSSSLGAANAAAGPGRVGEVGLVETTESFPFSLTRYARNAPIVRAMAGRATTVSRGLGPRTVSWRSASPSRDRSWRVTCVWVPRTALLTRTKPSALALMMASLRHLARSGRLRATQPTASARSPASLTVILSAENPSSSSSQTPRADASVGTTRIDGLAAITSIAVTLRRSTGQVWARTDSFASLRHFGAPQRATSTT